MKRIALFIIFCLFKQATYAQEEVSGRVLDHQSVIKLAGANITNLRTNVSAVTNNLGEFKIQAKVGDLISFADAGYQTDTLYLSNLRYLDVHLLLKQNQLNEVVIKGAEMNKDASSVPPIVTPFGGGVVRYQTDESGRPIGGLKFNIFDSHKDANKKARDKQFEFDEERNTQIKNVFNADNLRPYLPLKDSDLKDFIIMYTPDIKTYYSGKFNLLNYLNDSYKEFVSIPKEKRKNSNDLK